MRACIAAGLLVLAACGGGDDGGPEGSTERQFLDQWDDVPAGPDFEGHPTRVDESDRTLIIGDCDAARRATASGGPYGPAPRDPDTQESEPGYAYICP